MALLQLIHGNFGGYMKQTAISDISRSLIELAWHFGPKGLNGECCENLTMPEFIALDKVASSPNCPVQDVGYSLGFTKSGATRIVNRLEKKGYVEKVKSHKDARVCCVEITRSGEQVLLSANSRYMEQFHALVSKMSGHSLVDIVEMLTAMAKALKG
jgi:DNA-binding MarR family transcriptional regulator